MFRDQKRVANVFADNEILTCVVGNVDKQLSIQFQLTTGQAKV
jgi:hypothetical protein